MRAALARVLPPGARRRVRALRRHARVARAWIPYHLRPDGWAFAPSHVTLELTYLCNLRCTMCSLARGDMVSLEGQRRSSDLCAVRGDVPREVSTAEYEVLLRQMASSGVRSITLTGGEPTLRPDLVTLVREARSLGLHVYVISNGMARASVYRQLVDAGVGGISISLDGASRSHDAIRGRVGAHARAVESLRTLSECRTRRDFSLDVTSTVSSWNAGELAEVYEECERWSVDVVHFSLLHFSSASRQMRTEALVRGEIPHLKKPELPRALVEVDLEAFLREIEGIEARSGTGGAEIRVSPSREISELRRHLDEEADPDGHCMHPWLSARLDPWGRLYPCWVDVRMGDARRQGFLELWNGEGYRGFRRALRGCGTLPKCATCPALCDGPARRVPVFTPHGVERWLRAHPRVGGGALRLFELLLP